MSNYKESTISGSQWQRAVRVVILNPYNGVPSISFAEELLISLGDGKVITESCPGVGTVFDTANPSHVELYEKLDALYTQLRDERDAGQ